MAVKGIPTPARRPGRPVGVVAAILQAKPKGRPADPLVIYWTVARWRNDYNEVIDQGEKIKNSTLPKYEASLFESCFKNWG